MILVTSSFIWYLYTVITNWQVVTKGVIWVGVIDIVIPFSVNILIFLFLYRKLHLINYNVQEKFKKRQELRKEIKETKKKLDNVDKKVKEELEEMEEIEDE